MDEDSNMSDDRLLIDESAVSSSAPASPTRTSCTLPKLTTTNTGATTSTTMNSETTPTTKMATVSEKSVRKCNRITEFIEDKQQRTRSYFRRRHVPLKRAFDMDLQCGTQTFLIQISDDIEECLYYGHDKLVDKFMNDKNGLSLANVNAFIAEGKSLKIF